jgi:hypothetical protein
LRFFPYAPAQPCTGALFWPRWEALTKVLAAIWKILIWACGAGCWAIVFFLELLIKHSLKLIYGQIYFFLVYKKPLYSLAGILSFFMALPRILRERQIIQKRKHISNGALETMLSAELGEPGLKDILKTKLRWA